nr:dNTP triphosphohydrolase [Pirellula staleyi]
MTNSLLQSTLERETSFLAPYALASHQSRGRKYPEEAVPYRGAFQRDRDRIVHCSAFRRLSGKMQVFTGDMGDYHRTRLTHTHEVSSLARTVARALRLNEDLVEALALFHDIGHPPFGHAGEDALDECLAAEGGFSHNHNALVIAEQLEGRYPRFPGLNLTYEVLEGQQTRVDKSAAANQVDGPLLEVQVVEAADSMTYDAHDSDDAVKLGLVTIDDLLECTLVREAMATVKSRYVDMNADVLRKAVVHELLYRQVTDLLETTSKTLVERAPASAAEARRLGLLIAPSQELSEKKKELEKFLYERVYRHPKLVVVRSLAQQRLRAMFHGYLERVDLLPERFRVRAEQVGLPRSIGDYLAGMTDRFCDQTFHQSFAGAS